MLRRRSFNPSTVTITRRERLATCGTTGCPLKPIESQAREPDEGLPRIGSQIPGRYGWAELGDARRFPRGSVKRFMSAMTQETLLLAKKWSADIYRLTIGFHTKLGVIPSSTKAILASSCCLTLPVNVLNRGPVNTVTTGVRFTMRRCVGLAFGRFPKAIPILQVSK